MKHFAPIIAAIALVGGGAVVGWELRNWHIVIVEWYEKAAAYDMVGADVMQRIMIEKAKYDILKEREAVAPQSREKKKPGTHFVLRDGRVII
jgi:hypothetical protein